MIHIATIHWRSEEWIDLQLSMFRRHLPAPFQVYAYLTQVDRSQYNKYHHVLDIGDPSHADKLNALAVDILKEADDKDWIMFIDGDAFPIDNLIERIGKEFQDAPLVAVQRRDNLGEKHPHPSFCITTVGFWKEIGGNWKPGYQWINALHFAETDAGAELLRALTARNIAWKPLHRSNPVDVLPVYFGLYGDLIYHHGAGFRNEQVRALLFAEGAFRIYSRWDARILNNLVPGKYQKRVRDSAIHPEGRLKSKLDRKVRELDNVMRKALFSDPDEYIKALRNGEINKISDVAKTV